MDSRSRLQRCARLAFPLSGLPLLSGCDWVLMNPAGDLAVQQRDIILVSTGLMLLIVVPVMALIVLFAWRYRKTSPASEATYDPEWDHSTLLELVIWSAPLMIIIALGALTWSSTHLLDPYRPIQRIAPGKPVSEGVKPLEVDVVSLDWKWLFIYPEQGIATVNQLALPVDRPIRFRLTSSRVMNSFFVPAMAGQIYTMPGMETKLHAVLNKPGEYRGISANYSGAGFSDMHFKTLGLTQSGFDQWVGKVRSSGGQLSSAAYVQLAKPSEADPVRTFGSVEGGLFDRAVSLCVVPGASCQGHMSHEATPTESHSAHHPA
jgi:cytochrome o ubiquinol oxidase subunit 2